MGILVGKVKEEYTKEKQPFHFRMACLQTLGAVLVGEGFECKKILTKALN